MDHTLALAQYNQQQGIHAKQEERRNKKKHTDNA